MNRGRHECVGKVYRKQELMIKPMTYFESSLPSVAKKNMMELIFQKRIAVNQVFIAPI